MLPPNSPPQFRDVCLVGGVWTAFVPPETIAKGGTLSWFPSSWFGHAPHGKQSMRMVPCAAGKTCDRPVKYVDGATLLVEYAEWNVVHTMFDYVYVRHRVG